MTPLWCRALAYLALGALCLADSTRSHAQTLVGTVLVLAGIAALRSAESWGQATPPASQISRQAVDGAQEGSR